MRWPRQHTDSSLGELLDAQPEPESAVTTAVRPATTGTLDPDPAPDPDDGFLDDEDYLPQERRGPGRLTVALVAALVLAVGVLGGVWLQKQLGVSASTSGFAARQAAAGGPSGTGQRASGGYGYGGYGGAGTGTGAGTGAGAAGTGTGTGGAGTGATGGAGTATTPAVVGTVTSTGSTSLVVTDLGGARHPVTVTGTTTVTTPYGHGPLKRGDTVAVAGQAAADGSVAATGVTVS